MTTDNIDFTQKTADHISVRNLYTDLMVIAQRRSIQDAIEHLEKAVERIRAHERERCAVIADQWEKYYGASGTGEACAIIRGEIERG